MVAAALVTREKKSYLQQVQGAFQQSISTPEVLIIAHTDEVAVNAIARVFQSYPAVTLKVPQSEWGLESDDFRSVFEWAVLEQGISRLVLVGHSHGYTENLIQSWQVERDDSLGERSTQRESVSPVLEGARRAQRTMQESKLHFVNQIDRLYHHAKLGKALEEGALEVYGFFYLAQSGAFMAYDADSNTLQPIA